MKSIKFTALALLFFFISSLNAQNCIDENLIDPSVICFSIYAPVCGCDNVTYDNECVATHFGGVTSFTNGPCATNSTCVDSSLINLEMSCMEIYDPVCGCNDVTYSNSCYAVNFGGVTSYTYGPFGTGVIAEPCTDLGGLDFGECDMFMGFGLVNGVCTSISGCGWIVDNVDYSNAIYGSLSECLACLDEEPIIADECTDLNGVDFGACSMFLGIGVVNNQCLPISGCSFIVNGVNYSSALYSNIEDCQACLETNGINPELSTDFSVFPNPTNQFVYIETTSVKGFDITITTLSGQIVRNIDQVNGQVVLDVSDWSKGIYFLKIHSDNQFLTYKLVVQ